MNSAWRHITLSILSLALFLIPAKTYAVLTLTDGNNATTTPNVATAITGFQIIGDETATTPVKLRVTNGTLNLATISGVTMSGNNTATVNLSGTVANVNAALATLKYTRATTGTDTLEVALVNSNQIYFPDNGHVYQYVSGSITWNSAKTAAENLTAYGANGYLVTITSVAENNFVKARLSGDAWIGSSDSQTEGTWKWVTGPEAGTTFWQGTGGGSTVGGNYANWAGGEPNQSGEEDCGETYISNGAWNDLPCTTTVSGYVAEFGDNASNMPTVVAKNITITTADVPAITTLSPANGAATVSPTANLVITFSKTVTKDTGSILIKNSSGTTIETVDVAGSQVTGSGTTSITIDPASTLPEGTSLYVTIPNTAFKDGSNNYFEGISSSSVWAFTTSDVTAPIISSLAATSITDTGAVITWTTNESASSRVAYGLTSSYGTNTSETNTSPRVTSHSVTLSGLLPCTTYHLAPTSRDAATNSRTGDDLSFTTTGCTASSTPATVASEEITTSSGGSSSVTESGKTFMVTAPAAATTEGSSFVIQVKAIPKDVVLAEIGRPTARPREVGSIVFDVKAIVDGDTILDSFDAPVTIEYQYTDQEIAGLDERTLKLYHYHGSAWEALSDCVVDTGANDISCTTPNFSIFALFGALLGNEEGISGTQFGCKDPTASNYDRFVSHQQSMCRYAPAPVVIPTAPVVPAPTSGICTPYLTSYIFPGKENKTDDVRKLETFLIEKQGEKLTVDGVYGTDDIAAVKRFQEKYASEILGVWGFTKSTGIVQRMTLLKINSFYCAQSVTCPAFTEYNSMKENSSSAEVARTKQLLADLGFYKGSIDTVFDTTLNLSLKEFQETFSATMLKPWGLTKGSGYKYKTTNKFLNLIVGCKTGEVDLDGKGTFTY